MAVRVLDDRDALAAAAAAAVAAIARDAVAARGRFLVALSGGSTPRALHERLAAPDLTPAVDWAAVEFFWSDERAVGPDHPDSNYGMARATLLDVLDIADARVHRMRGEAPDLDAAASEYEQELARVCGEPIGGPPPALDLVLLGMGADGHTASLFPGTRALHESDRWVVANDVPQLGTRRLTFTFGMIRAARAVIVLVSGGDKASTLARVLEGPRQPDDLPARRLLDGPRPAIWFVDREAAARLGSHATRY